MYLYHLLPTTQSPQWQRWADDPSVEWTRIQGGG